jgi:hypothetical protein
VKDVIGFLRTAERYISQDRKLELSVNSFSFSSFGLKPKATYYS